MKVILLRDVAKIGKRFEIVNVPDGFALNRLIPAKDAEAATPGNVSRIEKLRAQSAANKTEEIIQLKEVVAKLVEVTLEIPMEANEQGHLFQGVHASNVVAAAAHKGLTLSEKIIIIDSPIKTIGLHEIKIRISNNVEHPVQINVIKK